MRYNKSSSLMQRNKRLKTNQKKSKSSWVIHEPWRKYSNCNSVSAKFHRGPICICFTCYILLTLFRHKKICWILVHNKIVKEKYYIYIWFSERNTIILSQVSSKSRIAFWPFSKSVVFFFTTKAKGKGERGKGKGLAFLVRQSIAFYICPFFFCLTACIFSTKLPFFIYFYWLVPYFNKFGPKFLFIVFIWYESMIHDQKKKDNVI